MTNYVDPTAAQIAAFNALDPDAPILMLNLLKFRETADYPEGNPNYGKGMTGAEAYAEYGKLIAPMLEKIGAKMAIFGLAEATLIGPDEAWDEVFMMHYETARSFIGMATDPDYVEHVLVHRNAATLDSRLIRVKPVQSPVG